MALAFAIVTTSPEWAQDKANPPSGKSYTASPDPSASKQKVNATVKTAVRSRIGSAWSCDVPDQLPPLFGRADMEGSRFRGARDRNAIANQWHSLRFSTRLSSGLCRRLLSQRNRYSLLSRVIGRQHERKRGPVVSGITGRHLTAIERAEEGFHEFSSSGPEHIQWVSGQCRKPLSIIKASTSTECPVEVDKGASRRCPNSDRGL